MLIVKNLFSFYVEFEILLHFLLFCKSLNVNKDVNMRNNACTRKIVHTKIVHTKMLKAFPYKNCGPQLSITDRKCSLVRSGKNTKMSDRNF
jgi:hypothetical protein